MSKTANGTANGDRAGEDLYLRGAKNELGRARASLQAALETIASVGEALDGSDMAAGDPVRRPEMLACLAAGKAAKAADLAAIEALEAAMGDVGVPGLVSRNEACPTCGERHMDLLVWENDEVVVCGDCGRRYRLGTACP